MDNLKNDDRLARDRPQKKTESPSLESSTQTKRITAPSIELPKGGGALRGIGEKFASNPVTGTGSMSVPIAVSTGRNDFGPDLALTYDSGNGNGIFGFGWSLPLAAITRRTDKGLPIYKDDVEHDTFLLSGSEDLVPKLNGDHSQEILSTEDDEFEIRRYRPRIEGLFARIERWIRKSDGDTHWRSISADNVLTIYGKDADSRIADPADPTRIFSWLVCEVRDDKGNGMLYEYKSDDGTGVDLQQVYEKNRGAADDSRRTTNRYLKRILYGNEKSLLENGKRPRDLSQNMLDNTHWMFELVYDYGEHDADNPKPNDQGQWKFRKDPFSSYRSGFEVRTTRLCERVLMFHHITDISPQQKGYDGLVKSTDFNYSHQQGQTDNPINPAIYTFLNSVTHCSYKRKSQQNGSEYIKRNLPPVEFEYSMPIVQDQVEIIEPEDLEHLPIGVNDADYQWIDLHNEGIPGILTEQANCWWYKRNISPISDKSVEFSRTEQVPIKPNVSLRSAARFMDLDGDGNQELVMLEKPAPGYYEHDQQEGWHTFKEFDSTLNRNFQNPNLKFIDLDGDGRADILISEDDAFIWHASLLKSGFGSAQRVAQALDEEQGPRLVFEDGIQSIFLADMCGDGLLDLVRVRRSQVCYWPNLGYCKFGAKITMANAPQFDHQDEFDDKRIRLADIDGSGTTDIIYLSRKGVQLYFNQSGNSWSEVQPLNVFPSDDDIVNIAATDLLGNGTACLVWSSPLPAESQIRMRYVNLMGSQKPHLLIKTRNNLGAETEISYAPSTKFYLADKLAGKPWITKLPFPVHVVEKVVVTDKWRKTRFASTYSYHHGHYDGVEREFRGFGRVEQVDIEDYGEFQAGNSDSPFITNDLTLYQPPVKTVTWFHTGVTADRHHILSQLEQEYFPHPDIFEEAPLPDPALLETLQADEWREAMRSCKGMQLRQEVYELDVDALANNQHKKTHLFSASMQNCNIQMLQPRQENKYAVFLTTPSQSVTYHYELDLQDDQARPDPRVAHTLNLKTDDIGNVLQAVSVVYPRVSQFTDESLSDETQSLIQQFQGELHISYSEARFTNDVDQPTDLDNYRLRQPCESLNYELAGIQPTNTCFSLQEFQQLRLSKHYQTAGTEPVALPYHKLPSHNEFEQRIIEHSRILYFAEDLQQPLEFGQLNHLALPFETYTLALTEDLLNVVFDDKLTIAARDKLNNADESGYLSGAELQSRFDDSQGQYWIRSGIAGFAIANEATNHFYLPKHYTDAFGNTTDLRYDNKDLFVQSSSDPLNNQTSVEQFDYRVLAPTGLKDINDNLTQVVFDTLGFPTAMAVKAKDNQADNLSDFDNNDALIDLSLNDRIQFFEQEYSKVTAKTHLGNATIRYIYDFGELINADGTTAYNDRPASAAAISRETHLADTGGADSKLQVAFEYSDGSGNTLVTKLLAEPEETGGEPRWVANGKTILNNKGNPVKQYEPYFTESHRYKEPDQKGVATILYYDAVDRQIRTELPDGSYEFVEFSPWHSRSYDANDTTFDAEQERQSDWYKRRTDPTHPLFDDFDIPEQRRAADLTAIHSDTPTIEILDSLGRGVISIEHNKYKDTQGVIQEDKIVTYTKLDPEDKPLWIRDDRGNLVMQYITPIKPDSAADEPDQNNMEAIPANTSACYSIAGELLFQHGMDGGDRWMINDAAGQPLLAWDENENVNGDLEDRIYHTVYDELRRPVQQLLQINDGTAQVIERFTYGEGQANAKSINLRGQLFQHYDSSGLVTNQEYDYKSNLLKVKRELTEFTEDSITDWTVPAAINLDEPYFQSAQYDALNRMTHHENWHIQARDPAVYRPKYNQQGLLVSESLTVEGDTKKAIVNIEYDAKGQRQSIEYDNNTVTTYRYDPDTFRLVNLTTTRTQTNKKLQNLNYIYDPVGNITEIIDKAQQKVFFNNQQVTPNSQYEYDALYRLIKAEGREHAAQNNVQRDNTPFSSQANSSFPHNPEALQRYTETYQYDSVGNILHMTHGSGQGTQWQVRWKRFYQYALNSNRLLATSKAGDSINNLEHYAHSASANLSVPYQYDTHGSMLNLNRSDNAFNLHWDYDDRLHHINLGGGGEVYYNYGSDKERSRKRIIKNGGNITEERLYLGGMERYRRWVNNDLKEEIETYHLIDGEQRVLMVENVLTTNNNQNLEEGVFYRYQYGNHLGSVGLELDGNGSIISYKEYHPYGTTAYSARDKDIKAAKKRYRYTGMERDEESGLSYHSARYYLPWLGRWGSVDPAGLVDGGNLYGYSKNAPINSTDLDGYQAKRINKHTIKGLSKAERKVLDNKGATQEEVLKIARKHGYEGSGPFEWNDDAPKHHKWVVKSGKSLKRSGNSNKKHRENGDDNKSKGKKGSKGNGGKDKENSVGEEDGWLPDFLKKILKIIFVGLLAIATIYGLGLVASALAKFTWTAIGPGALVAAGGIYIYSVMDDESASGTNRKDNKDRNLEGQTEYDVFDPDTGNKITDIDLIENGVLWEHKSAGDIMVTDPEEWVEKHLLGPKGKVEKYLKARKELPGYEKANIGFYFSNPNVTSQFKSAVEKAIVELRERYKSETEILVKWR